MRERHQHLTLVYMSGASFDEACDVSWNIEQTLNWERLAKYRCKITVKRFHEYAKEVCVSYDADDTRSLLYALRICDRFNPLDLPKV